MKNIIIILASIFLSINAYSQSQHTSKLQSNLKILKVDDSNYKYYGFNAKNNILNLYNLDNSLWKSITLNIPEDAFLDEILDVSTGKLNQNPDVEVVYTIYSETYSDDFEYVESEVYENYDLVIMNESGKELLSVNGGRSFQLIDDLHTGKTILVDVYNKSNFCTKRELLAYSDFSF